MIQKIIIAGFGGQGVMVMGELIAYAAMYDGKNVTCIPSYGPEMRGGTANCSVVVSDEPIASPVITTPDILIAMNEPSLKKFEDSVLSGGMIFYNSSLIDSEEKRGDVSYIAADCITIAAELHSERIANMVMLGAVIRKTGIISPGAAAKALEKKFTGDKAKLIQINKKALSSCV